MSITEFLSNILPRKNKHAYQLAAPAKANDRVSYKLKRMRLYKAEMQMDEWRKAVYVAEDPQMYDRRLLIAIYREAVRDAHVLSQILTVQNKIISEPFSIAAKDSGTVNEEIQNLLERPWFDHYLKYAVESEFWGYSLVEFQDMVPGDSKLLQMEFNAIKLLPREHVKPEQGLLLLDLGNIFNGVPFREEPFNTWLVGIGNPYDLGLLLPISREVIWKNYSRTDWSRNSEKFGMPFLVIRTPSNQDDELDKKEEMAANFGSNGYAILDNEDDISFLESQRADPYQIYLQLCQYCDQQMSKAINGQTGTSDEKSFVGSAEVHERVLNDFIKARLRRIQYHINFELFPFLIGKGYPLAGYEFTYPALTEKSSVEKTNDKTEEQEKELSHQKKKFNY